MRLLTYVAKKGAAPRVGVLVDGPSVLPLPFKGMIELIESRKKAVTIPRKSKPLKLSSVRVLAPIPRPRKNVFCVGWNYVEHFEEGAKMRVGPVQELPAHPTFFTRPSPR
jgi:2-keto-4-pentenoate hydratase/2-oxohepta-3-ene-1,7-dioic acid hydratase in catechol pathway